LRSSCSLSLSSPRLRAPDKAAPEPRIDGVTAYIEVHANVNELLPIPLHTIAKLVLAEMVDRCACSRSMRRRNGISGERCCGRR
jgi:hypothetical protein